jgi:thiamine biosynthesis lipoprotein
METVRLARNAMATRFECVLQGSNPVALRSAGEEALDEIDRLEQRLSLFRPSSAISLINARAAKEPVHVTPEVFWLIRKAKDIHGQTAGAFDITIAPLMRAWGFMGGKGGLPDPAAVAQARDCVGMHLVELDSENYTVRFTRPGVMLDLGAIGKGFAVDVAVELLREAGVTRGLIHGGTSTAYGIGTPIDQPAWVLAIEDPRPGTAAPLLATVPLKDQALSVSAVRGKSFCTGGEVFGHILDPRTAAPAKGVELAAVGLPTAADTDALSTALLVLGEAGVQLIGEQHPKARLLVLQDREGRTRLTARRVDLARDRPAGDR